MDTDTISISIPDKESFVPLLRLVLGGIAMRKNVCFDDLDDVQLAVEDLLANRRPDGGQIVMTVRVADAVLDVTVQAKVDDELCRRLQAAPRAGAAEDDVPALDTCRLLRSLMDSFEVQELPAGWFSIRMTKQCQ